MPNRLANENSPYLLQHADNPVDWYPWGEEALEKARRENKPIFLSIGYAACHWCHVMAHESFEDPNTAAVMNEYFVNVKVDREERPDLDSIYMSAVVAMTGQGGWPMSVFLTPEGRPFFGGTYYPPVRRYNMPSFGEVLASVQRAWERDRSTVDQSASQIAQYLEQEKAVSGPGQPLEPGAIDQAAFSLAQAYDWKFGGWGQAPRFPQPMAIEFLLRRASRGDRLALDVASHALRAMARGGMYDVVGGGFARYSTDDRWLVPHFEKMLYDNAQLARAYLHAHLLTGDWSFRRTCEETLDFISRELAHPQGGFFSSLDADSEGEEGKYYLWSLQELRMELDDPQDMEFLTAAYGVTETGNFEGKNILQRALSDEELAEQFSLTVDQVRERLIRLHDRLLKAREKRVRPATDDKVLVSWNALALIAFAEAARYLQREDYLEMATRNASFLLEALYPQDRLLRSWRAGQARHNAYLEDYAGLILGLLALYQSDPQVRWFKVAAELAEEMVANYRDPAAGFFDTRQDQGLLITRPKDLQDNATPSGNSLAAMALLQLSSYTARGDWRDQAEAAISAILPSAARYPTAFGGWLCAAGFALAPVQEVAILSNPQDPSLSALTSALWAEYRPDLVAAQAELPLPTGAPPLLSDRSLLEGKATAYVCRQFVCLRPATTPQELKAQLSSSSTG